MESEIFTDATFFNGIINDAKLKNAENGGKLAVKKPRISRKSSPTTGIRKPRLSQKENITPENKKTTQKRAPRKSEREPLKPLNEQKPTDATATLKKTVTKSTKSTKPTEPKPKKDNSKPTVPKIIIYKDDKEKTNVKKTKQVLSKSWDGTDTKTRRSLQKAPKSPELPSKSHKHRHSLNDLRKSPNKKEKKTPTKTSPGNRRVTRFKPGQPELEETLLKLEILFPNIDPEFLRTQLLKMKSSLSETIEYLILKEKTNELPTKADYIRRKETEKLQNKFWEDFSVENFVKMIPDPWEHFLKTEKHNCVNYLSHSIHYLKNKYKKHYAQAIQEALSKNGNSLYLANKELHRKSRVLKMRATNRSKYECDAGKPTAFNIQFVHEVAFIENETKIKAHIKKAEMARYKKLKEAEESGGLLECQSCNDFSLLSDDAVNCPANHVFCKDCVVKYVEIEIGKNNFQFKCLVKCEEKFSTESLQEVLSPFVMTKIVKRNQLEEIKSAGVENLAYCPFCFYVALMSPELTIFKCFNPNCMIESCRSCKQVSHAPLKCQELEKFDKSVLVTDVEVEEEGNFCLRCDSCNGEFLKREDSDQMVCPCGATICSICQQPVPGCPHSSPLPRHHTLSASSDDTDCDEVPEAPPRKDSELPDVAENLLSESSDF